MGEGGLKTALEAIRGEVKARFEAQKRVLSFREYLELVQDNPRRYTRDAGRYLKDCMDFFGSYEVERPTGNLKRWKLFDLAFGRHGARAHAGDVLSHPRRVRAGRACQPAALAPRAQRKRKIDLRGLPDAGARGLFRHRRWRALSVLVDLPAGG